MTKLLAVKTIDSREQLATGDEPELHRLIMWKQAHGEWQFPVVIEREDAQPWDDTAYLRSMQSASTEKKQIKAIKEAHQEGYHTIKKLAENTGMFRATVGSTPSEWDGMAASELVPKLSDGINKLTFCPNDYIQYEAPNGWGKREHCQEFLFRVLALCRKYPFATVREE